MEAFKDCLHIRKFININRVSWSQKWVKTKFLHKTKQAERIKKGTEEEQQKASTSFKKMAFNINLNTKIMKTPYSHLKQVLKVFSYQFPDNLASACFLCSAVIYSQASKIFTIIKVCWTVLAFTHILPFIPSTSSNGYNCDNSWIISHLGAKSLQTRLKKVRGRSKCSHLTDTALLSINN